MEEHALDTPESPRHNLTPEARRRDAVRVRKGLQARIDSHLRPGARLVTTLRRVWSGAYSDGSIHAGNLAYMAILSLFPFFITVAAIFALVGEEAQRAASVKTFLLAVPPVVRSALEPVAMDVVQARTGGLLWVGGLVGLWTVSSLIETIRDILRRAYGTPVTSALMTAAPPAVLPAQAQPMMVVCSSSAASWPSVAV